MASIAYDKLKKNWDAANRYDALADVDILITATSGTVKWEPNDGSNPSITAGQAPRVYATGDPRTVSLKTGESLWLAGPGTATLTILTA